MTSLVALGVAALPIAPALHSLTAAHADRYCPEHQRFEEVARSATPVAPSRETSDVDAFRGGVAESESPAPHLPCVAATWSTTRIVGGQARASVRCNLPHLAVVPEHRAATSRTHLVLSRAPKHSPPTLASV